ncbi:MAG: nitroreductase [Saprospiraceae bacterium]|jgi:nitroreductase|tara:strand:+ start:1774 stop:2343 length:570 start_codon:yes stop_codon:yes gene_type:complete
MKPDELTKLIKSRRSIFPAMYNDKPIDRENILKILENGNWAPNHKRTEPWRFKIYQGESLKSLSIYLGDYYTMNTPPEKYSEIKLKKTIGKPLKSACVIALCLFDDPNISIPRWEQRAALACSVQNMWLTCTSLGIGSYWSSPKSMINGGEFLGLAEHEECLGLFYMGYTDVANVPGNRGPIKDKIEWK